MNNKDCFNLSKKFLKKFSLKKKIFISILVVMLLIVFIPFAFYSFFSKACDFIRNGQFSLRKITVYGTMDSFEEYEKIIDNYDNEHIVHINKLNQSNRLSAYKDEKESTFMIFPNIKTFFPDVEKGDTLKNDGDIICPTYVYGGVFEDDTKFNELEDYSKIIGEDITFNIRIDEDEYIPKTFKLVGTYNADPYYNYSTCYIKEKDFMELTDLEEEGDVTEGSFVNLFTIYVDDYKEVDEIADYLKDNDIDPSVPYIDNQFVAYTFAITVVLFILLVICSLFLLMHYFKDYYKEEYKNIALYKALGYKDKDIIKIMFMEISCLIIIALMISVGIYFVLKSIILTILKNYVAFRAARIGLPFILVLIYFVIVVGLNYLFLKIDMDEVNKMSIKTMGEL